MRRGAFLLPGINHCFRRRGPFHGHGHARGRGPGRQLPGTTAPGASAQRHKYGQTGCRGVSRSVELRVEEANMHLCEEGVGSGWALDGASLTRSEPVGVAVLAPASI